MKQQTRNHFIFIVILIALFWGLVPAVHAQTPFPSDNEVNQIASKLYCPVCENIPLDVCGTTACAQWRELIRQKLAEGWTEEQITEMWRLILKQSEYSFNRGHAVAYGLLSYLTAYLKTHYTVYFMTACLIAKQDDPGKIGIFINECNRLHIRVLPPSVNRSDLTFAPNASKNQILFGLGAIKGLGDDFSKQIIADRPYEGFQDFLSRVNGGKVGTLMLICEGIGISASDVFAELEGQRRLAVMKAAGAKRWRVVRLLGGREPVIVDSFDIREQAKTLLGQLQENANQRDRRMEKPTFELMDGREESDT